MTEKLTTLMGRSQSATFHLWYSTAYAEKVRDRACLSFGAKFSKTMGPIVSYLRRSD